MPESILEAMRQSIIDGAPDTALALAQTALASGLDLLEAINDGFVPGMHHVGEQFVQHAMFLPDMMASAEAMRAAMQVLEPELKKQGAERPVAGTVVLGNIPEPLARHALASAPREFFLYDRAGHPAVHYGGDDVHFDPGSSCLNILDADTQRPRLAQSGDLVRLVQLTEMLSQYAAQSRAVCATMSLLKSGTSTACSWSCGTPASPS
jgi:hypothetical protein